MVTLPAFKSDEKAVISYFFRHVKAYESGENVRWIFNLLTFMAGKIKRKKKKKRKLF